MFILLHGTLLFLCDVSCLFSFLDFFNSHFLLLTQRCEPASFPLHQYCYPVCWTLKAIYYSFALCHFGVCEPEFFFFFNNFLSKSFCSWFILSVHVDKYGIFCFKFIYFIVLYELLGNMCLLTYLFASFSLWSLRIQLRLQMFNIFGVLNYCELPYISCQ